MLEPLPGRTAKLLNSAVHRKSLDESTNGDNCYICHESGRHGDEMVR